MNSYTKCHTKFKLNVNNFKFYKAPAENSEIGGTLARMRPLKRGGRCDVAAKGIVL